ncbi:S-layer homology domain-containing protein [Leucobacter sp.]
MNGSNRGTAAAFSEARSSKLTRLLALLLGFALLCFGMVAGAGAAQAAGDHTVSGTIQFPASAPSDVRVPWGPDGNGGYVGIYLTLDIKQDGTVEGWQLGKDANVSFDPATGAWAVTGVPDDEYRLNISVSLPNNGYAPGSFQELTVSGSDVAVGTTSISEEGRLRAAIARCGWENGDETAFYVKNTATGAVYTAEPAQSGWVEPSTDCPPEVSYGNYSFSGVPAGNYTAYSVWNGDTQYYTGFDAPTSSTASDALVFSVKNWEGTNLEALVFPHVVAGTPTIAGTAKVGQALSADPGTWQPASATLAYQWLRDGSAISGATSSTYTPVAADQGKRISVKVTGTKAGYEPASKTSAQTAAVAAKPKPDPDPEPTKPPFTDVSKNQKFAKEITWMYTSGLSTGVKTQNGREYQPKTGVSREAMAAFLYRMDGAKYTGPKVSPFADVKPGDKFYDEITWMYAKGLSTGVQQSSGKPDYQPKATVTREAMAAFIYRLEGAKYTAPNTSFFSDIARGDKFYREISWMYDSGLSTGVKQPSGKPAYQSKAQVTREAMAAFLYRLEN